jgi:propanol-preferring alcohol dehydrogenase
MLKCTILFPEGSCPDCKHGRVIYCDNLGMVGINKNGAFAEYVVVDSRFSVHLPDNMAFEEAA